MHDGPTWQRLEGSQAQFFPHHDSHPYAVECVLGFREGFYCLVSTGWDLRFRKPVAARKDPAEAGIAGTNSA